MKHPGNPFRAALVASALALSLAPLRLAAQDRAGTVEIGAFGGGHFGGRLYSGGSSSFSDDVEMRNAPTFGLRAAYNVNEWLGVEGAFSTARSDIKSAHPSARYPAWATLGKLDEKHYDLDLVFHLGHGRFVPYLAAGAGATHLVVEADGAPDDSQTRFAANFAAGLKASVASHLALRLEWRVRAARGGAKACDPASPYCDVSSDRYDDRWYYRWSTSNELTGGVTFTF